MLNYLRAYAACAVVFIALDAGWLTIMGKRLYRPLLQGLLADTVRPAPALLFYALYVGGIVGLAVAPSLGGAGSMRLAAAAARGAGLGLVAYATYDLTNQATLRNWPPGITVADLCWGVFATTAAAAAGCLLGRWGG